MIRPVPAACATAEAAQGKKGLPSRYIQVTFTSESTQLGEYRLNRDLLRRQPFKSRVFSDSGYIKPEIEYPQHYRMNAHDQ
jgi:hypothetical protein